MENSKTIAYFNNITNGGVKVQIDGVYYVIISI